MPTPFTGADFLIQSATQLGAAGIRIRFTHDPLASSSSGAHDGLNISQYSLTGPVPNEIRHVATVPDDPQSLDLALDGALVSGLYTLTISNGLQTADGRSLQVPYSIDFSASFSVSTGTPSGGAVNDTAESTIRKHLPPSLVGKAWNALIAALAVGDRYNWDNFRAGFDQLYRSTASGLYLDRHGSNNGLTRPPDIGMPDDLFRRLLIKTTAAKLTPEVLLEIMEIFYGSDSLRASCTTELSEPFVLNAGDGLNILQDGRDAITLFFREADFNRITQAKAVEVASVITRAMRQQGSSGYAVLYVDPSSGAKKVRIYSGSLGLASSLQITGGRSQLGLNFPSKLVTYSAAVTGADAYNWAVTSPEAGLNRITLTNGGGTSKVDLTTVRAGDYLIFEAANSSIPRGIYPIIDVAVSFSGASLVQSLDIAGSTAAHSFLQLSNAELTFFRPTRRDIHQAGSRTVVIAQTLLNRVDIQMPATTQAVGRGIGTGAYLHDTVALPVSSIQRLGSTVSVNTSSSHGLSVGSQILVEDLYSVGAAPSITAGVPSTSGSPGTSDYSLATTWSQTRVQDVQSTKAHAAVTLADGRLLITGGYWNNGGGDTYILNCQHLRISATTTQPSGARQYTYNWDAATSMGAARAYHGASRLLDGRVLVSGGYNGAAYLSSAALYTNNGGAGTWANTNSMATLRRGHVQITLDDGRVLSAGGLNGGGALSSCEIWDPGTTNWTAAASMAKARSLHAGVKLKDGRVLIIGGSSLGSCEIYDPGGNSWSTTGSMAYARSGHSATLLGDGRVLVIGGTGFQIAGDPAASATLRSAEIYDPAVGSWAPAGRMATARSGHGALLLSDGRVLVAGGAVQKPEYFDPRTFCWRFSPNAPTSVDELLSQSLSAVGAIAVLHGGYRANGSTPPAYLYQPGEDVFAQGGLNGVFTVATVPSSTSFTYLTPDYQGLTLNVGANAVIKPMAALTDAGIPGPFIFDTKNGVAITGTETEATMDLLNGSQYSHVDVADATAFPDEPGWLAVGFGTDNMVAPVPYLGRQSNTALTLDYGFHFTAGNSVHGLTVASASRVTGITTLTLNLPAGVTDHGIVAGQRIYFKSSYAGFPFGYKTITGRSPTTVSFADAGVDATQVSPGSVITRGPRVTLLRQKGVFTPDHPETLGACYITASSAGRLAAIKALEDSLAAGINAEIEVVYPGDRGLGGEGLPAKGAQRLSDKVTVWGGDHLTEELEAAREDV
jgi:hypothetical protein